MSYNLDSSRSMTVFTVLGLLLTRNTEECEDRSTGDLNPRYPDPESCALSRDLRSIQSPALYPETKTPRYKTRCQCTIKLLNGTSDIFWSQLSEILL